MWILLAWFGLLWGSNYKYKCTYFYFKLSISLIGLHKHILIFEVKLFFFVCNTRMYWLRPIRKQIHPFMSYVLIMYYFAMYICQYSIQFIPHFLPFFIFKQKCAIGSLKSPTQEICSGGVKKKNCIFLSPKPLQKQDFLKKKSKTQTPKIVVCLQRRPTCLESEYFYST